jgi:hypothetical protein
MPTMEPDLGGLAHRQPSRAIGGPPLVSPPQSALERVWRAVRVSGIDTRRAAEGGGMQVVHARVHLGVLLPLDVVVELECTCAARDAEPSRWRMWSDHPQGGGNFVFEARLPETALTASEMLSVRVCPAPDSPTDSVRMAPAELTVRLMR